jgi:hypothetical protein
LVQVLQSQLVLVVLVVQRPLVILVFKALILFLVQLLPQAVAVAVDWITTEQLVVLEAVVDGVQAHPLLLQRVRQDKAMRAVQELLLVELMTQAVAVGAQALLELTRLVLFLAAAEVLD